MKYFVLEVKEVDAGGTYVQADESSEMELEVETHMDNEQFCLCVKVAMENVAELMRVIRGF